VEIGLLGQRQECVVPQCARLRPGHGSTKDIGATTPPLRSFHQARGPFALIAFSTAHPNSARMYARRFRGPGESEATADHLDKVLLV